MRHERPVQPRHLSRLTRRRFQFLGALIASALIPFIGRIAVLPETFWLPSSINALIGNAIAVAIAFWLRLSIEPYPGIRSTYVIFPAALIGHGLVVVALLLTRLPTPASASARASRCTCCGTTSSGSTPSGKSGGGSAWCRSAEPRRWRRSTESIGRSWRGPS